MTNRYRDAKRALWSVSEEIYDYAYDYYSLPSEWDGRDLFITSDPAAAAANAAERDVIVTSAAPQLAWLFGRLCDAFARMGEAELQLHHYVRLTGIARAYELTSDREYKVNAILREVMNEAFVMFREMEKEGFESSGPRPEIKLQSVAIPQVSNRRREAVAH
jgi:hypothetical protein